MVPLKKCTWADTGKKKSTSAKIISQEYVGFLAFVAAALVLFGF